MFTQARDIINAPAATKGLRVMTQPDIRWGRRDIKTTQLLAQSLAKMTAVAAGYDDTWMVDGDGNITEGSSNNAWIRRGSALITRPPTHDILKRHHPPGGDCAARRIWHDARRTPVQH